MDATRTHRRCGYCDHHWTHYSKRMFSSDRQKIAKRHSYVKEDLASGLLLTHFDPILKIVLATDAPDYGVGAVILHKKSDGN
ncbi:unnamed protein product [Strongylus vulgaris]|uniref:Uncharacterized protein n=1 Tax=Strongylus vulgaris TaxID=40348 RepID=A0A3P7INX1_STRVU|nr:unnamed protein product [Strongylus vulgaris]